MSKKQKKLSKDEPKAKCCRCLRWISLDEYFENDNYCEECAKKSNAEIDNTALHPLTSESHFKQWCYQDRGKITNESN